MNPAAFIHALQHLTEDSNGVLWVVGNPMPLPQLGDASTSSNRDTSFRNPRRHQETQSPLSRPLKRRIILNPDAATHTSPQPPRCVLQSSNIFVLSVLWSIFLYSFPLTGCISFFSSLFSFCSSSPPLCQLKNCPRANNITDSRTPFSSCFCSQLLPRSPP